MHGRKNRSRGEERRPRGGRARPIVTRSGQRLRRLVMSATGTPVRLETARSRHRSFAVNAIRSWWTQMGRARYPNANSLLITADGGGSNGSRVRLWKVELQKLADQLGLAITVVTCRRARASGTRLVPAKGGSSIACSRSSP